jgi:hypothetical protein
MSREEINTAIRQCLGEGISTNAPATAVINSINRLRAAGAEPNEIQAVSRTAMRMLAAIYAGGHDQSNKSTG